MDWAGQLPAQGSSPAISCMSSAVSGMHSRSFLDGLGVRMRAGPGHRLSLLIFTVAVVGQRTMLAKYTVRIVDHMWGGECVKLPGANIEEGHSARRSTHAYAQASILEAPPCAGCWLATQLLFRAPPCASAG